MRNLGPTEYELLIDAGRYCFWYKDRLGDFLKRCGVPQEYLRRLGGCSKLEFMRWLVDTYEPSERGRKLLYEIAFEISKMVRFPDVDDVDRAKQTVLEMKEVLAVSPPTSVEIQSQAEAIAKVPVSRHADLMSSIPSRLNTLFQSIGTREAGYDFEKLVCDLALCSGLDVRRPFRGGEGRQFDGSISVDGITYLLECKFRTTKSDAPDISNFRDKVSGSADLTQGLFVSMSGYTEPAVQSAGRAASPIVLLCGEHVLNVAHGAAGLDRVVRVAKRNAAETGAAYMRWSDMKLRFVEQ